MKLRIKINQSSDFSMFAMDEGKLHEKLSLSEEEQDEILSEFEAYRNKVR